MQIGRQLNCRKETRRAEGDGCDYLRWQTRAQFGWTNHTGLLPFEVSWTDTDQRHRAVKLASRKQDF